MFRYLERSENTARLLDAGLRLALTRTSSADDDWDSVISTAGVRDGYFERHRDLEASKVVDFVLRDPENPSSVRSVITEARNNARRVRTALTREVWEATNQSWLTTTAALDQPVPDADLPRVLNVIRQESALVRGALHGTMMRNEIFNFARLGSYVERADNTARILDVKYYVLLPSARHVGSHLDNVQWTSILRSVSAERAFRWAYPGAISPRGIAEFLILDRRMPRSLAFCYRQMGKNLGHIADEHGTRRPSHDLADELIDRFLDRGIDSIFDAGLHEFLTQTIADTARLGAQIETDYRFTA